MSRWTRGTVFSSLAIGTMGLAMIWLGFREYEAALEAARLRPPLILVEATPLRVATGVASLMFWLGLPLGFGQSVDPKDGAYPAATLALAMALAIGSIVLFAQVPEWQLGRRLAASGYARCEPIDMSSGSGRSRRDYIGFARPGACRPR